MTGNRLLVILAMILGFLGVALLLVNFELPGRQDLLRWFEGTAVWVILAIVAILACILIFRNEPKAGGALNVALGIGLILIGPSDGGAVLILCGGVLGLVAGGAFGRT